MNCWGESTACDIYSVKYEVRFSSMNEYWISHNFLKYRYLVYKGGLELFPRAVEVHEWKYAIVVPFSDPQSVG
jgi:hypothetical protein